MLLNSLQFLLGLGVLVVAADVLVRSSAELARRMGVSPFVIGLTLIGIGTSAPELVVSISAAMNNSPDLATGNIVGSNIANIGLILGAAALVCPLAAQSRLVRVECPLMILVSLLFWWMGSDGEIGQADGLFLLGIFCGFMIWMAYSARRESRAVREEIAESAPVPATRVKNRPSWLIGLLAVCGLAGLIGGAEMMVRAAVEVAEGLGVPKLVIGLTVVAVGTSLPELAASVAAALKGESDVALGNVVGSNIFNIVLVLAATALVSPLPVSPETYRNELPVMAGFAVLLVPILLNGMRVKRWEGGLLLGLYVAFMAWQAFPAKG